MLEKSGNQGEKSGNLVTSRDETTAPGGKQNILAPATRALQPTEESVEEENTVSAWILVEEENVVSVWILAIKAMQAFCSSSGLAAY